MNIRKLSDRYRVRTLSEADIEKIYQLCLSNPLYYQHCPPAVTKQHILEDMTNLPPGKTSQDKLYLGYFVEDKLVAVMDLIIGFPEDKTAFIGFFMVDKEQQGQGVGTDIIAELSGALYRTGFYQIQLAYAADNPQSRAFWQKNYFRERDKRTANQNQIPVIVMQRELGKNR